MDRMRMDGWNKQNDQWVEQIDWWMDGYSDQSLIWTVLKDTNIRFEHFWFAVWTQPWKYGDKNTTCFDQRLSEAFHYWLLSQFSQKDLAALLFAEFNHASFQAVWEMHSSANVGY